MLKRDLTAEEEKEASEIAARLSCCVADILTADFAADAKVANLIMAMRSRFDMLQLKIVARRGREQRERERQHREAEEAFAARERQRANDEAVAEGKRTGQRVKIDLGDGATFEADAEQFAAGAHRSRASWRRGPEIKIDFTNFDFRGFYGGPYGAGPSTSGATQRSPHDGWRESLRDIAGDKYREGMSDAALFKAAQEKAHPDRCGGDGTLFKKVTDLGQRLGVVDDQGRVMG